MLRQSLQIPQAESFLNFRAMPHSTIAPSLHKIFGQVRLALEQPYEPSVSRGAAQGVVGASLLAGAEEKLGAALLAASLPQLGAASRSWEPRSSSESIRAALRRV